MASTSATRQLPTLSLDAAKVAAEGAQDKAKQMGIGEYREAYKIAHFFQAFAYENVLTHSQRRLQHRPSGQHAAPLALHAHAHGQADVDPNRYRQGFHRRWPPRADVHIPRQELPARRAGVWDSQLERGQVYVDWRWHTDHDWGCGGRGYWSQHRDAGAGYRVCASWSGCSGGLGEEEGGAEIMSLYEFGRNLNTLLSALNICSTPRYASRL